MTSRKRVLVIAEAANPEWVSVPLIGWSLAKALKDVADVHIVTQIRNRDAFLRAGLQEDLDFTAIDSEAIERPVWKLGSVLRMGEGRGWTTLQALASFSYPYFEHLLWKRFGSRIERGEFDLVHRITPLSPTVASPIAKRCANVKIPFVLGPLNGGVPWPPGFQRERLREREILASLRSVYKVMPGRHSTLAHAAAILAGSQHTRNEIPAQFLQKSFYLPENAVNDVHVCQPALPVSGPMRACFIGRMVPYKGPDMLIEAAEPLLRSGRMSLDMIGSGPLLAQLQQMVTDAGLQEAVTFHGWVDHATVQSIAGQCSLLAFPSIREFGGGAVLEAMALGVAPLIVDYAGPTELVTADTGFKVPIGQRDEIVAGFRSKLAFLADNPDLVAKTGERARDRVRDHFTWARKAEQIDQIYDWVLGRTDMPRFSHSF